MGLFEELASKFGFQNVEPFKEPTIIIDCRDFRKEWERQLKGEGCKILVSDFLGRSCFLIRKPQASNNSVNEQPTPQPSQQNSNVFESITELIKEGKTFKEIKESLGLSHAQLMGYLSNLKRRGVLDKIGWIPERRKRKASTREAKNEPAKPSLNTSIFVREMLEASLMLLDSHPKVVRLLLQKCMESLP
jgi:hypothetical protein